MSRLSTITVMTPQAVRDAAKMAPLDALQSASFFKKLTPKVQEIVLEKTKQLAGSMRMHQVSGLAVGEHLTSISEVLQPQSGRPAKGTSKNFTKFLRTFHFAKSTAYRYMATYKVAKDFFPPTILEVAMSSGIKLLGTKDKPYGNYTEAVKILPPPSRNPDEAGARRYLTQLETVRKEKNKRSRSKAKKGSTIEVGDPKTMLKECYRFFNIRFEKLPGSAKKRVDFVEQLAGMMLSKAGVSHLSIKAAAIPEEFQPKLGRPVMVAKSEGSAEAATA